MQKSKSPLKVSDHSISLFKPFHGEEEIEAVAEVLRSGWWGQAPKTAEFEQKLAPFVGAPKGVSLNSATAGWNRQMQTRDMEYIIDVIRNFPHA